MTSYVLPKVVNLQNATMVEKQGSEMLTQTSKIQTLEVDCQALTDFDSSLIAICIAWQKQISMQSQNTRDAQNSLQLIHAPEKLRILARVYGVDDILSIH